MASLDNEAEAALVGRALDGCPEAFGELVRLYAPRVSGLVYQHVGNAEAARDISQTVFLRAFRQIRSLRNVRSFRSWLFRIAVNEATDFLRRRMRERSHVATDAGAIEELPARDAKPLDSLVAQEEREAVLAALDGLPPRQRTVFVLRHFQGMSNPEIAEVLSCSTNAVKANLSYALRALREKLCGGDDRD
jgi:RNA polymerase sigma-70 factor (ECF subfamily)